VDNDCIVIHGKHPSSPPGSPANYPQVRFSGLLCEPMVFSAHFCNSEEAGVEGPFAASALRRGTDSLRTPPPTPPSVDEESSGMRPPI
jgi:hypothetical protein